MMLKKIFPGQSLLTMMKISVVIVSALRKISLMIIVAISGFILEQWNVILLNHTPLLLLGLIREGK